MLTLALGLAILSQVAYSTMIICAVSAYWFGNKSLGSMARVLCWITGIINLPAIIVGGLGLIALAACYASYRVSERVRYKFRTPAEKIHPDFDRIIDTGLN